MARILRQSTSIDIPIGPFLDATDGVTAETALTITQPDIRLKKNGGVWAQKNAAQTLSHEENGNYEVTLDATDTNTLGLLRLHVNETGALPVWEDFLVVTANVWDSLFSTDLLQIDVAQWLGSAVFNNGAAGRPDVNLTFWKGITPNDLNSSRVDAHVGAIGSNVITAAAINADAITAAKVADGTIDAATFAAGAINAAAIAAGAIDDDALAADVDSYAAKCWVIRQSTTADQYGVTFYKNGQPLESGITSPLIDYVKKLSDASILVNDATLTDESNGDYFYSETTNKLVAGNAYMMRVTATIDGSSRVFKQQVGRDSI